LHHSLEKERISTEYRAETYPRDQAILWSVKYTESLSSFGSPSPSVTQTSFDLITQFLFIDKPGKPSTKLQIDYLQPFLRHFKFVLSSFQKNWTEDCWLASRDLLPILLKSHPHCYTTKVALS